MTRPEPPAAPFGEDCPPPPPPPPLPVFGAPAVQYQELLK